jgi:PAS domain S-box-containing protein
MFTFLRDENNKAIGLLGVSQNISERKRAEQKLKESEILFRDLYEEAPNAYFSIGPDKSILRCNNAAEKLLGYTKEELLKVNIFDLYYKDKYGVEKAKELFNHFLQGENIKDVELKMKNKKGEPVWISLSVKPIYDQQGNVIESRSMILDINERKLAQEELKKSFEKLKEMEYIINNSPGVLFLWKNSENWPVEFVSENVKQFGYTPGDFYSGKVSYGEIIHPDDLERIVEEVSKYSNSDIQEFVQEYRIVTKSGEIKWLDDRTWIRRDKNGNITHFEGIVIDITDRKAAEAALILSEKKFKEAFDMANFYKDLFTHDMNNILQVINSSAEIISFQLGDSEKSLFIENMTKMIQSQIDRGSKLISDVRTLTTLDEEEIIIEKININKFLIQSINFMKKAYSERNIFIIMEELSENYYTRANELLQDVFDNILMNGIKYNENENIEIDIKISKQKIEKKKYIQIEFIDNGIGIHDYRKELIFQPGNRELKGSKGMGIGLSLVSKIIEIFNGKIWVEDKVRGDYNQGSKFIILLPEKT